MLSDEIDVVNDRKSPDNNREIDSSMSTNNTSVLESPSTGSSNNSSPASISTHSPLSSDSSVKKKVRTNYSPSQVQALEKIFHENPYPEPETMEKLASDLNIPEAKIKVCAIVIYKIVTFSLIYGVFFFLYIIIKKKRSVK